MDEVSARRSNSAIYLEGEGRPLQRLLLQSAVRAERYSDFGSTSDGKVAGRLELVRGLALRGSLSTGFRAPALSQQYFSSTRIALQPVGGVNTVLTVRTFPVSTPEAQLMGATPLRPESAVNRSAGLVLDVPRFPVVTADLYRIDIDDRIGLGGVPAGTRQELPVGVERQRVDAARVPVQNRDAAVQPRVPDGDRPVRPGCRHVEPPRNRVDMRLRQLLPRGSRDRPRGDVR